MFFWEYVQNIAMVIIFTSFLGLIIPRSKHKSYIKLITGLVIILAIISPVAAFFSSHNLEELFLSAERQLNVDIAARAMQSGRGFEDTMLLAVFNEHRAGIEASLRTKVLSLGYELVDVRIYIDESDERFGMISHMMLVLSREQAEDTHRLIRVERISIASIGINSGLVQNRDNYIEEINMIKNLLSDFYNLSVENIDIIVK